MAQSEKNYFNDLQVVTTVPEVAELWGVNQSTVVYHIMRDNITAVKIGSIWIVSLRSVLDFWGTPRNLPVCEPFVPLEQYKTA